MVLPLFIVTLLGAVQAGVWSIEQTAATAAAEQGVRVAVQSGSSQGTLSDASNSAVGVAVEDRLRSAMFGTRVRWYCEPASSGSGFDGRRCPTDPYPEPGTRPGPSGVGSLFDSHCPKTPAQVRNDDYYGGAGTVVICMQIKQSDPPKGRPGTPDPLRPGRSYPALNLQLRTPLLVEVTVVGCAAAITPVSFGSGCSRGEIPIQATAVARTEIFIL
jgi:hypothetical protein